MKYLFVFLVVYFSRSAFGTTVNNIDYFITNRNVNYLQYDTEKPEQFYNAIDTNCTTVFFIHGWRTFTDPSTYYPFQETMEDFAKVPSSEGCYNTLAIRWSDASNLNYFVAASEAVIKVSNDLVQFITALYNRHLLPGRVECTGHSLGAHTCGTVGRKLKTIKAFEVVTGLDSAGFSFTAGLLLQNLSAYKLGIGDASLVVTLMTSGGSAGTTQPLGDVNFSANGGSIQPGCNGLISCSHSRATDLYHEAVLSKSLIGLSSNGTEAVFGRSIALDTPSGIYNLNTGSKSPFSLID